MEKMFSIPISRRDFMKMTGLAAAGVLAVNTVGMPETVLAASEGRAHGTIKYAGKEIPVLYSVDVCVAGGGPGRGVGRSGSAGLRVSLYGYPCAGQ